MRKPAFSVTLLLVLTAGCGIPKDQYQAKVREADDLRIRLGAEQAAKAKMEAQLRDLERQGADLKARVAALSGDVGKAESDKATLSGDLAKMKKTLEDLKRAQAAAERRAQAFRNLVAKFKAMVDSGKLAVEIRNGLMLVKLPDHILFDPGKVNMKKEGQAAIAEVTKILIGVEGRKFQVAGHTDNQAIGKGSKFKSNWDLSTGRALTGVDLMINDGMDPKRLSAAGYADVLPIASNDTDEGRKQNRRIEIVLMPNIEDLPVLNEPKKTS
jgi:chemotaxis protein MotB